MRIIILQKVILYTAAKNSAKSNCKKTGIFGQQIPFSYISAPFGPLYDLFGPFLTLSNTQTPFLGLLGEMC